MRCTHGLTLTVAIVTGASGQEGTNPFQKDAVDRALERAVAYLIGQQSDDGAIVDGNRSRRGRSIATNSTAMTSLAIMAIASLGHQPGDPTPEGTALGKALDCVLDERRQTRDGYFGSRDHSRMYGHGITALMLGEILGMGVDEEQDTLIRKRLDKALECILRSQKVPKEQRFRGGWRYSPDSRDADLSVTVWQVMALRSAKNAGLDIARDEIDEAADYVRRSHHSRRDSSGRLADPVRPFAYQPGSRAEYSTAAAGVLALQVCGFYDDPTVIGASDWLLQETPNWNSSWFFYGTYYYAQGMYQRGGRHAAEARKRVREIMLKLQQKEGYWEARGGQERSAGRVYATSLAVLSLSVKYHYPPIYQR